MVVANECIVCLLLEGRARLLLQLQPPVAPVTPVDLALWEPNFDGACVSRPLGVCSMSCPLVLRADDCCVNAVVDLVVAAAAAAAAAAPVAPVDLRLWEPNFAAAWMPRLTWDCLASCLLLFRAHTGLQWLLRSLWSISGSGSPILPPLGCPG